ncbi:winged helix-turn-helix transcriptional regulator [Pontivivens ytuae]|uniref:Helix-turn-helix transcriptional regulator n=1 Tax=Pontivivens ytuae TaxID=2789856 RepID=A0A7S9LPC5_9RHOB|nr:helix-turn-helix domain-containing protein [Pontivivens ytuae]QPH52832.1 helix-turn-helix transcriptional regulator [Pontivivens ytuae]
MARIAHRDRPCPRFAATEALKRLMGRWKVPILLTLADGPMRYAALHRALVPITHKMLAQQLAALEADDLIERRELVADPPKVVEYRLGPEGERARVLLAELQRWGAAQANEAWAPRN